MEWAGSESVVLAEKNPTRFYDPAGSKISSMSTHTDVKYDLKTPLLAARSAVAAVPERQLCPELGCTSRTTAEALSHQSYQLWGFGLISNRGNLPSWQTHLMLLGCHLQHFRVAALTKDGVHFQDERQASISSNLAFLGLRLSARGKPPSWQTHLLLLGCHLQQLRVVALTKNGVHFQDDCRDESACRRPHGRLAASCQDARLPYRHPLLSAVPAMIQGSACSHGDV